jgi:hypothetical protein
VLQTPLHPTPYFFPQQTPLKESNSFQFSRKKIPLTPKPAEYKFMLNETQLSQRQLITPKILTPVELADPLITI